MDKVGYLDLRHTYISCFASQQLPSISCSALSCTQEGTALLQCSAGEDGGEREERGSGGPGRGLVDEGRSVNTGSVPLTFRQESSAEGDEENKYRVREHPRSKISGSAALALENTD